MKLIKPSFEIIEQPKGLDEVYKQIELAGRTCYKSENKITETSCKEFVKRMIESHHNSMLEHGTIYLMMPIDIIDCCDDVRYGFYDIPIYNYERYMENPYSKIRLNDTYCYITTNYRVLVENGWLDDLQYLCGPTKYHEKRITVKFITSNSIMRELTRHRTMSFAVESTRYCNYSKDKFDNEITFIEPYWYNSKTLEKYDEYLSRKDWYKVEIPNNISRVGNFECSLIEAEKAYLDLIECGAKPQEAREVLPLSTKSEIIVTGFTSSWEHLFRLRTSMIAETGKPHPDMSNLCDPLYEEFIQRGYIKPIKK